MGKRVLVVDNDRFCVEILGDILSQAGYAVSKAYDGMEALDAIQRELPDLVFLDIVMPKIDGDRLFSYIRSHPRTRQIPIVIVSGTLAEEAGEVLGMKADAYVAKSRRDEFEKNILTALQRIERGAPEANSEILGLAGLVPRHKVKELLGLRRFSQKVQRTIAEGIVQVDGLWRILFANRACLEMIGRSEIDLIGTPVADILAADHRAILEESLARFTAFPGESGDSITVRHLDRVLDIMFAWIDATDPSQGFFMILRDVTDLARKIEQLSEMNARLQAMDRMRSELLTMVSHDLHTPLTAIKGSLEVLLNEGVGVELRHELLGIAKKNADRLFRLVSDILDLARIEAGRFARRREPFDVTMALRGTVDRLRQIAQSKEIAIAFNAPEGLPAIPADAVRMEQVFTNLVGNALKFTHRGGRIDVTVEDAGADLLIKVEDSGVGIPREHLDRIFDRFYRAPLPAGSEVEGTGLGLSICRAVVDDHGGRIWVESQVGRGSAFFVTIPKEARVEATA